MYWILFYDVVDDYVERRAPFRDRHLSHAESSQRMGMLYMAGAYADPVDGAALVFKADDIAVIEQFVRDDPYVQAGLVTSWSIRRWNVVIDPDSNRGFGQSRSGVWGS
jgi:uncharacterized protein YciI